MSTTVLTSQKQFFLEFSTVEKTRLEAAILSVRSFENCKDELQLINAVARSTNLSASYIADKIVEYGIVLDLTPIKAEKPGRGRPKGSKNKNSATAVVDKTHRVIMEKLRASCTKPELVDLYSDLTRGVDITAKLLAMVSEHVDAKGQTYIDLLTPEPVEVSVAA
jgi:hypothetical protein